MAIKPVSGEIKSQDINDNLSYLDNKLSQVNGGPLGSLGSVAELNQKYPNGANGFFIIDGHMYFWENNKWIDKGIYQAKDVADGSVTNPKIATNSINARTIEPEAITVDKIAKEAVYKSKIADRAVDSSKTDFIKPVTVNLFNYSKRNARKALNQLGELVDSNNYFTTNYIEAKKDDVVICNFNIQTYAIYDMTKKNPVVVQNFGENTFTMSKDGYLMLTFYSLNDNKHLELMISTTYMPTKYVGYQEQIENSLIPENVDIAKCEAFLSGKNKIDTSKSLNGYRLDRFGDLVDVSTNFSVSDFHPINAVSDYTVSSINEIFLYDKNLKPIIGSLKVNNTDSTWSFKTTKEAAFFRATFGGEGNWSQLEEGAKYTGYEKPVYTIFSGGVPIQVTGETSNEIPILDKDPEFPKNGQIWIRG